MTRAVVVQALVVLTLAFLVPTARAQGLESRTCLSADGVRVAYTVGGQGDTALLFIHGGLADRNFFQAQLEYFASRYRVVALDLAGHGESGRNRKTWGIPAFAEDVKAVAEAERLQRVVLLGNSLGGPVAIEAALLLPGRVVGVVGIDTFQDLGEPRTPERVRQEREVARQLADAFRKDVRGALRMMLQTLFHPDANRAVVADAERRMLASSTAEVAGAMLSSLVDYDYRDAGRRLPVPLRAINGDIYPTDVQRIRAVRSDFDAVIMTHMGHYPMLERPGEFNRHVTSVVASLVSR